jgi:cbb3-type cytochrome oxidase subunit 3
MKADVLAYLVFGTCLVVLFLWIIIHYYSKKRHKNIESPKYKILEEDD